MPIFQAVPPKVMALFDVIVESSIEGMHKPQRTSTRSLCERLGIARNAQCFWTIRAST